MNIGRLTAGLFFVAAMIYPSLAVLSGGFDQAGIYSQTSPTPAPAMPPFPFGERLAPPPTVYPPSQADEGAQVYYLVCMACHGDKGQGLTEEWRNVLSPADRNCWQSKCHASNHPPEGFKMPEYVPPVMGPGLISVFGDASTLHSFLKARMPWQAPGSLSEEEYWQLTAFLIRQNGLDPGSTPLNEQNAKLFSLQPEPTVTPTPVSMGESLMQWMGGNNKIFAGTGILLVIGFALGLFWVRLARGAG
jgi:hypothetical protein